MTIMRAIALSLALAAVPAAAFAAPSPRPLPTPVLPKHPLHNTIDVEVNARGQVVGIRGGTLSKDRVFDTMTIGNALQMWIRKPDGTAETGVYRVKYDYDPRTHDVQRHISLVSAGGSWGKAKGAATEMTDVMKKEAQKAEAMMREQQKKAEQARAKNLPDIKAAVRRAVHPSASPSPKPR